MATKSIISHEKRDSQISKTSEELDCLEENIIVAPHSLALLGQIMLLSTQRDFSLISKPVKQSPQGAEETTDEVVLLGKREDFKYITHPESFRATLVQVSNAGYHAFLAAHTNMDKIKLACDNVQEHVESITECVIEGEDDDITSMVPVSLQSMRKTAQDCAEWSREICSKFHHTLNLLEEVHCSCHAAQMTNQEKLDELERQKKVLAHEKEEAEINKHEKKKEIAEIEQNLKKDREAFLKDYQESQHKITDLTKGVISEEDDLAKFKLEQEIAQRNVDKEKARKGWVDKLFSIKTDGQVEAEYVKSGKDDQVSNQQRVVNTKRTKADTDIESEKKIIDEKKENMKSKEARGIDDRKTSMEKMEALSNKISEALIKINSADVKKLDIEGIKALLKEGIEKVAELEAHWKKLVIFFEKISNVTEVAMGKAIEDFANAAESAKLQGKVAEGSSNSLKTFTKKKLMQFAFNAYSRCHGVYTVSKSYLKISETYLMPSIIQLGTLVAIDAEREPEKISAMTKEIQSRSQMTIDFVKQVVTSAKLENENEVKTKAIDYK